MNKPLTPSQLKVAKGRSLRSVKRSKYNAKPTVVDGVRFASYRESLRYMNLKLMQLMGKISLLQLQPQFDLHVTKPDGTRVKIGQYRADFKYFRTGHSFVVEDVKGVQTDMFKWKLKHVEAEYGIKVLLT